MTKASSVRLQTARKRVSQGLVSDLRRDQNRRVALLLIYSLLTDDSLGEL